MSFEQSRVYTTSVLPGDATDSSQLSEVEEQLRKFILSFYINNLYIYREQLRESVLTRRYLLEVNMGHVLLYNEDLGQRIVEEPAEILPLFEAAAKDVAKRIAFTSEDEQQETIIPSIQVVLSSDANPLSIRDLTARHISKLVRIPGIVISASSLSSKATVVQLMCRNCRHLLRHDVSGGFSGLQLPRKCQGAPISGADRNDCPPDPYVVVHDKSQFIDQQVLKLQESPEMVPVGEMPRHVLLTVDRNLCNRAVPGSRCTVLGIYSIYQNKVKAGGAVAIRNPYIRVVGISVTGGEEERNNARFTEEEEEEFLEMSRTPDLYEKFAASIAPSIYGHSDVKKSIACLLVGGSRRLLPDATRLRGDINVLLLGDPGTAKSQLLKFVEKVAPIAIYTSGKGSSAAGLTASVQRDAATSEFYLEGGAMVLADGGVVCIDEFDKMRDEDRVAIHEAMEQQTISIAKAGITTVLNSRTSVLAAANPIFGRYDDMKTPGENIDFQTTILSRFDMIYIIRDEHNEDYDQSVAKHVMNTHIHGSRAVVEVEGEIPLEKMKRYVRYCRAKCAPRLSPEAAERLVSHFVEIRKSVHDREIHTNERSSVPITVRQLEAMVRVAESIAKLHLAPLATEEHVDEAIRLFYASTMNAIGQDSNSRKVSEDVHKIEAELKRRLPVGYSTSYNTLLREFVQGHHQFSKFALDTTLHVLERRDIIQFRHQRQNVFRSAP
ncbi:DNA replication licensing factor mcm5 [Wickerhamiella sorbophila]|uniref:DNA replication licensing factor MCM5 n=1 Tax=Wickerhamiella sorbophila TaxID=45607 RepID=A0A2T0FF57_9ASCO|nr:DNA replication licensing factor mcm5 [Wickerhamiella sorbophila]PRT53633.1 DNA replication licensing factor mcm5 [Wickerhamiella sorbophila]